MRRLWCCRCWKQKTSGIQWVAGCMRWSGFSVVMFPAHYWKARAHGLHTRNGAIPSNACVKTSDITVVGMTSHHLTSAQIPSSATGADGSTQKSFVLFLKIASYFQAVVVLSDKCTCPVSPVQISSYPKHKNMFMKIYIFFNLIQWICCDRVDPLWGLCKPARPRKSSASQWSAAMWHVWSGWMMPFQNDWCFV